MARAPGISGAMDLFRRSIVRDGRFALLLHGVSSAKLSDFRPEAQPRLTATDLSHLVDWLRQRFHLLTPDEYLAARRPGVLLTFDDGFANNFNNALPVLESFGAPGLFFITTQHVIDPRNWLDFVHSQVEISWGTANAVPDAIARDWYDGASVEQIRQCSSHPLVTVGSHGVSHAILTECSHARAFQELSESKRFLETICGTSIKHFAYPKGAYNEGIARQAREVGYTAAFAIDPIGKARGLFELPRVGVYDVDRLYLAMKLSGLHRRPLRTVRP